MQLTGMAAIGALQRDDPVDESVDDFLGDLLQGGVANLLDCLSRFSHRDT
jgi:hypothetical protein